MNYYEHIKRLNAQIFAFTNYKKLNLPLKILCGIATLPFSITCLIVLGLYYLLLVLYYCIKSPLDYLHGFVKNEGQEVKHATQFIIYFIAFPVIFIANIILSLISCLFFIYNLFINIYGYLATLGGINYIPFLFDDKVRNDDEIKTMNFIPTIIYGAINLVLFIASIFFVAIDYLHISFILFIVSIVFSSIFLKFARKENKKIAPPLIEAEDYE